MLDCKKVGGRKGRGRGSVACFLGLSWERVQKGETRVRGEGGKDGEEVEGAAEGVKLHWVWRQNLTGSCWSSPSCRAVMHVRILVMWRTP